MNEQSGIVALIDAPVVEGFVIKEWSIRQFSILYPYLKSVVKNLQASGMTIDNAYEYIKKDAFALIDAFIPILPEMLEISLNLSKEQIDEIPAAKAVILGVAVIQKNTEHVTSFLSQIKKSVGEPSQPE